MAKDFLRIDLNRAQKKAIQEYAFYCILDEETKDDLTNNRVKWVRFGEYSLDQVIGELSYKLRNTNSDGLFYFLDELISNLAFYQK